LNSSEGKRLDYEAWNPLVSIIIPVYNGSNFMREAIDSALAQTYDNCEILVINDGSNDNGETEKIALSYGSDIRYYAKENGGVSTALNMGIANMKGEYFSWLSHDDMYYPEKIQYQIDFIKKNCLPQAIIYCGYEVIDEFSDKEDELDPTLMYPLEKLNMSLFPVVKGLINGCSLLIHKDHFERTGLFDNDLKATQDYDLWFKMFRNAEVRCLPNLLVIQRKHMEQSTHRIKETIDECNDLWINMIKNISEDEMKAFDGSKLRFYREEANYLVTTKYRKAYEYVNHLYKTEVDRQDRKFPIKKTIKRVLKRKK